MQVQPGLVVGQKVLLRLDGDGDTKAARYLMSSDMEGAPVVVGPLCKGGERVPSRAHNAVFQIVAGDVGVATTDAGAVELSRSRLREPLRIGHTLRLMHVQTGLYLTELSDTSERAAALGVESREVHTRWQAMPRYRVRPEGTPARAGDVIVLRTAGGSTHLALPPPAAPLVAGVPIPIPPAVALPPSSLAGTDTRVLVAARPAEESCAFVVEIFDEVTKFHPADLRAGDCVQLLHCERGGYLRKVKTPSSMLPPTGLTDGTDNALVPSPSCALQGMQGSVCLHSAANAAAAQSAVMAAALAGNVDVARILHADSAEHPPASTVFVLENARPIMGGAIRSGDQRRPGAQRFRLRSLVTAEYLSCGPSPADGGWLRSVTLVAKPDNGSTIVECYSMAASDGDDSGGAPVLRSRTRMLLGFPLVDADAGLLMLTTRPSTAPADADPTAVASRDADYDANRLVLACASWVTVDNAQMDAIEVIKVATGVSQLLNRALALRQPLLLVANAARRIPDDAVAHKACEASLAAFTAMCSDGGNTSAGSGQARRHLVQGQHTLADIGVPDLLMRCIERVLSPAAAQTARVDADDAAPMTPQQRFVVDAFALLCSIARRNLDAATSMVPLLERMLPYVAASWTGAARAIYEVIHDHATILGVGVEDPIAYASSPAGKVFKHLVQLAKGLGFYESGPYLELLASLAVCDDFPIIVPRNWLWEFISHKGTSTGAGDAQPNKAEERDGQRQPNEDDFYCGLRVWDNAREVDGAVGGRLALAHGRKAAEAFGAEANDQPSEADEALGLVDLRVDLDKPVNAAARRQRREAVAARIELLTAITRNDPADAVVAQAAMGDDEPSSPTTTARAAARAAAAHAAVLEVVRSMCPEDALLELLESTDLASVAAAGMQLFVAAHVIVPGRDDVLDAYANPVCTLTSPVADRVTLSLHDVMRDHTAEENAVLQPAAERLLSWLARSAAVLETTHRHRNILCVYVLRAAFALLRYGWIAGEAEQDAWVAIALAILTCDVDTSGGASDDDMLPIYKARAECVNILVAVGRIRTFATVRHYVDRYNAGEPPVVVTSSLMTIGCCDDDDNVKGAEPGAQQREGGGVNADTAGATLLRALLSHVNSPHAGLAATALNAAVFFLNAHTPLLAALDRLQIVAAESEYDRWYKLGALGRRLAGFAAIDAAPALYPTLLSLLRQINTTIGRERRDVNMALRISIDLDLTRVLQAVAGARGDDATTKRQSAAILAEGTALLVKLLAEARADDRARAVTARATLTDLIIDADTAIAIPAIECLGYVVGAAFGMTNAPRQPLRRLVRALSVPATRAVAATALRRCVYNPAVGALSRNGLVAVRVIIDAPEGAAVLREAQEALTDPLIVSVIADMLAAPRRRWSAQRPASAASPPAAAPADDGGASAAGKAALPLSGVASSGAGAVSAADAKLAEDCAKVRADMARAAASHLETTSDGSVVMIAPWLRLVAAACPADHPSAQAAFLATAERIVAVVAPLAERELHASGTRDEFLLIAVPELLEAISGIADAVRKPANDGDAAAIATRSVLRGLSANSGFVRLLDATAKRILRGVPDGGVSRPASPMLDVVVDKSSTMAYPPCATYATPAVIAFASRAVARVVTVFEAGAKSVGDATAVQSLVEARAFKTHEALDDEVDEDGKRTDVDRALFNFDVFADAVERSCHQQVPPQVSADASRDEGAGGGVEAEHVWQYYDGAALSLLRYDADSGGAAVVEAAVRTLESPRLTREQLVALLQLLQRVFVVVEPARLPRDRKRPWYEIEDAFSDIPLPGTNSDGDKDGVDGDGGGDPDALLHLTPKERSERMAEWDEVQPVAVFARLLQRTLTDDVEAAVLGFGGKLFAHHSPLVQRALLTFLTSAGPSQAFLHKVRTLILRCSVHAEFLAMSQVRVSPSPTNAAAPGTASAASASALSLVQLGAIAVGKDSERKVLNARRLIEILGNACRQHRPMQDYLRVQSEPHESINLVAALAELLQRVAPCCNSQTDPVVWALVTTILDTLMQLMQGPCNANQDCIVALGACGVATGLLRKRAPHATQRAAVRLLLATCAGRRDRAHADAVLDKVNFAKLVETMDASFEDWKARAPVVPDAADLEEEMSLRWFLGIPIALWRFWCSVRQLTAPRPDKNLLDTACNIFIFLKSMLDLQRSLDGTNSGGAAGGGGVVLRDGEGMTINAAFRHSKTYRDILPHVATIEVVRDDNLQHLYFVIPDVCTRTLRERTRQRIIRKVDRATDGSRLESFIDECMIVVREMDVYDRIINDPFRAFFDSISSQLLWLSLMLGIALNIVLLASADSRFIDVAPLTHIEPHSAGAWAYDVLGAMLVIVNSITFINTLGGPLRVYLNVRSQREVQDLQQKAVRRSQELMGLVPRTPKPMSRLTRYALTAMYIAAAPELWETGVMCVTAYLGYLHSPIWFCAQPLQIIFRLRMLFRVVLAVVRERHSLLLTAALLYAFIYLGTVVAYYWFSAYVPDPDVTGGDGCDSLASCFVMMAVYGFKAESGVADISKKPLYTDQNWWLLILYYMAQCIIVPTVLFQVVFGLILNTFTKLREERQEIQTDQSSKCFICGLSQGDLERDVPGGFEHHVGAEHNMWHYLYLIKSLTLQQTSDDTGLEAYVARCVAEKNAEFFPIGRSMSVDAAKARTEAAEKRESNKTALIRAPTGRRAGGARAARNVKTEVDEVHRKLGDVLESLKQFSNKN